MNNYQVFITDGIDVAELDTENIDLKSVFSLLDITNIAARKDNLKTITFKGTKTNNNAFGSYFDLSRDSDVSIPNNLFFNYNPLKSVTAFVYENSNLIFKGSLRLTEINVDANGQVVYSTIVTGSFIDLKTAIQDKYLADLDFSDMEHLYDIGNITNSWTGSTGYVYPNIDYGYYSTGTSTTINQVDCRNFKPSIFVTEYLDRIFNQDGIGFTYEIKGSPQFKEMFGKLIVPDAQEGMKYSKEASINTYSSTASTTNNVSVAGLSQSYEAKASKLLGLSNIVSTGGLLAELQSPYDNVLNIKQNVTTSLSVSVPVNFYNSGVNGMDTIYRLIVATRPYETGNSPYSDNWQTLGETSLTLAPFASIDKVMTVSLSNTSFTKGNQLGVILTIRTPFGYIASGSEIINVNEWNFGGKFTANTNTLLFPSTDGKLIFNVLPTRVSGDTIQPVPPVSIKQMDFLKSLVNQFNFIVYVNNDNHKHIMFETYDDFYVLTRPQYIINNSLDWTYKIDYKNGFKAKSNLDLPKSYLFTNKTDTDYLTDTYQSKFAQVYGQLNFDDSYGLQDTKKVELIFSPMALTTPIGTDRKFPLFYKLSNNIKTPTKTNIRLAFWNGLQPCNGFEIYNDEPISGHQLYYSGVTYPQVSNYYAPSGTSLYSLDFGLPLEYYFSPTSDYTNCPNSYDYYINQVTDLTNPNVVYVECNVLLNAIDIANLDLKVPVYVNTGKMNGAYFKVLKVEYDGSNVPSKVLLQKIGF